MYKSFRVQNFRGFRDLQLDDLARVNLIAGKNNTGKSALLEAIYTYTGVYDSSMLLRIPDKERRSFKSYRLEEGTELINPGWPLLFHNFETSRAILLCGQNVGQERPARQDNGTGSGKSQQLKISLADFDSLPPPTSQRRNFFENIIDEDGRVLLFQDAHETWISFNPYTLSRNPSTTLLGERGEIDRVTRHKATLLPANKLLPAESEASLFTDARRTGQDKILLSVVSKIEPRTRHIELLSNGLKIELHGHIEGLDQPLPLSSMGEGMRRITSLMLAISTTENGIVLIDEVENGLHYSVQTRVWQAIAEAVRACNVQIFATTHSYEMILAAHEAFSEKDPCDLRYFRLSRNRDTNDIQGVAYEPETLEAAIEVGFEVR